MKLKLMDYRNRRKTFELPDDVLNIDIEIMFGDEVAVVTTPGGTERYDSCDDDRTADKVEMKYTLYRAGDTWPNAKWEKRKDSYDGRKIKEREDDGEDHHPKPQA